MDSNDKVPWWVSLIIGAFGALIMLLAVGVIPASPESFHAPRLVVAEAGLAFVLVGFLARRPNRIAGGIIVAMLWLLFGLIFGWAALFADSIQVTTNSPVATPGTDAGIGRVLFGGVSILGFVCSFWTVVLVTSGSDVVAREKPN